MREVVLKKSNRGFLDLFWEITSPEVAKSDAAVKDLLSHLSAQRNDIDKHISYTLDRLSKGLRSSTHASKLGFSRALVAVLQKNKNISTEAILFLFDKHVFAFKASDMKEKAAANMAKIECLYILYKSGRLSDLKLNDHKRIVACLTPLINIDSCIQPMQLVLSEVVPLLPPKIISIYGILISPIWDSAWKTDEPTAGQILFILRLQNHAPVMAVVNGARVFQIGDKSMIKRIVNAVKSCLQNSEDDLAADLVSQFKSSPIFTKLWTRLSTPIYKPEIPISQRLQVLKMSLVFLAKLDTEEQIKSVLTLPFLTFLRKQLSNSKLSSHEEICRCVNVLLSSFNIPASEGNPTVEDGNNIKSKHANDSSVRASYLFYTVADQMPLFDINLAPKAPHFLSALMNCASSNLSMDYLYVWARRLQQLFLSIKNEDSLEVSIDRQRVHILELLRQIVIHCISRASWTFTSPDDECMVFISEAMDFFLLIANSNAFPLESAEIAISSVVVGSAFTQLGRCLTLLIRSIPLTAEFRNTPQSTQLCKQGMKILLHIVRHLLSTDMTICSGKLTEAEDLLRQLKLSREMFDGITDCKEDPDVVRQWIVILHASTVIYTVTLHSPTASPKEVSLISLLDDISEALRHRVAHETDAASLPSFAKETSTPEWSSVLTDVMLSLCVEPWRLLREVVGATFGRIVAKGELFAPSIKLSMFEHAEKTGTEDDGSLSPLQLILSIADGKSRAAQERVAVAGEEEDEEDTGASSEDDLSNEAQREDIGSFEDTDSEDNASVEDASTVEKMEIDEREEEEEEFLTNDQMEAQDETLAALFRASRSSKIDSKTREQTVALLKLRSFDFLEYLLLYSSNPNLFLPTLHAVLELAVASAKWTSRIQQKQKLHQVDKHGHVPLIRVASCLGRLRSRPLVINQMLCQSLDKSDDVLLSTCLKAIFRTFKNAIPDDKLINCCQIACDFLLRKVASQNTSKVFNAVLKDVLTEFLSKTHPSRAHQFLLTRLISSSSDLAELASGLVIEHLKSSTSSSSTPTSSRIYAQTSLLSVANAVTGGLASSKSQAMCDWALSLSQALVHLFFMMTSNTSSWLGSKALAVAVFDCLSNCLKADKTVVDRLIADELTAVLALDRSTIPKAVRPHHSRLIQFIRSLRDSKNLSAVLDSLGSERKREKAEAKQARREKRKAKKELEKLKQSEQKKMKVELEEENST